MRFTRVVSIVDKMRGNQLRYLGKVLRKEETEAVRLLKDMYVDF